MSDDIIRYSALGTNAKMNNFDSQRESFPQNTRIAYEYLAPKTRMMYQLTMGIVPIRLYLRCSKSHEYSLIAFKRLACRRYQVSEGDTSAGMPNAVK